MEEDKNPSVAYAESLGVSVTELHLLLCNAEVYGATGAIITLTEGQIKVLKACLEVACEF